MNDQSWGDLVRTGPAGQAAENSTAPAGGLDESSLRNLFVRQRDRLTPHTRTRTFALAMRMQTVDKANTWTEIRYVAADFDADVDDGLFTTFALRGR